MKPIKIYSAEKVIAEQIRSQKSIAYAAPLQKMVLGDKPKSKLVADLNIPKGLTVGSITDMDLYYLQSVLVTTSWNKNDDVFGREEVWPARYTPAHKPTNLDHDEHMIVGHITNDVWVIDDGGQIIEDDVVIDDLPDKFHVVNGAVIYQCWEDEKLIEQAQTLVQQIEAGEKYVSMECVFSDFDYAVDVGDGQYRVVPRNKTTAWMTKHLRAYGGDGLYDEYKVGRYLKNIIFVGKGYTDQPANPESIIFNKENMRELVQSSVKNPISETNGVSIFMNDEFKLVRAEPETAKQPMTDVWSRSPEGEVATADQNLPEIKAKGNNPLPNREKINMENIDVLNQRIDELKTELKTLSTENKGLEKQLSDAGVSQLKTSVTELEKQLETVQAEFKTGQETIEKLQADIVELESKVTDSEKNEKVLQTQLDEVKATELVTNRTSTLVDGGLTKEDAVAKVEKFIGLNNEQFETIAKELIETIRLRQDKTDATDNKTDGNTDNDADNDADNDVDDKAASSADKDVLDNAKADTKDVAGVDDNDDNDADVLQNELVSALASAMGRSVKE